MKPAFRIALGVIVLINFALYMLAELAMPETPVGIPILVRIPMFLYIVFGVLCGIAMVRLWKTTAFHALTLVFGVLIFAATSVSLNDPYFDNTAASAPGWLSYVSVCGIPILIAVDGIKEWMRHNRYRFLPQ